MDLPEQPVRASVTDWFTFAQTDTIESPTAWTFGTNTQTFCFCFSRSNPSDLKPLQMYTFVILLSAFKYKRKIAYAVLKMIVHKAKKKKRERNCKQAYQTGVIYTRKILHFVYETITNKNKSV